MEEEPLDFETNPALKIELNQIRAILRKHFPDKDIKECSNELLEFNKSYHVK